MSVNYDIWGAPETWELYTYSSGYTPAEFKTPSSTKYDYKKLWNAGTIELNEIDISPYFWGISKDSMFAQPQYISAHYDGDLANPVLTVTPITQQEPKDKAMMLAFGGISDSYVTPRWDRRYAPDLSSPSNATIYTQRMIMSFNYQKIVVYPWIYAENDNHSGTWYPLKSYIDNYDTRKNDYHYIKSLGFAYYMGAPGERSSQNYYRGGVVPILDQTFDGFTGTYESRMFWARGSGLNMLGCAYNLSTSSTQANTLFTLNDGYGNQYTTPNASVATADTGFRYKYCLETSTSDASSPPIYYFNPNDELWEYKCLRQSSWRVDAFIDAKNHTADEIYDYFMKQTAYFGFPFLYDSDNWNKGIGEGGIFLPVFDEYGVTTGEYLEGEDALELPNAEWVDGREAGFDPNRPTPGGDDGDEGIKVRPSTPGFTLAGRGTQCYELIESDIDEIFDDIYGRDNKSWNKLIKGLQMFGSDPMGAIISFKWYPFTFTPGESKAVYLGNTAVNPLHQYPTTDGISKAYVSTTATFKWDKPKNFVNSRYTKCRIYLPFYGFYELPISMMISKTLSVYMAYNVPDETAVWILSFDDVIYDFCECDPSIEIPLTGSNAGQIALVKRQAALSIAAQVAAVAGTAIVGATTGSGLAYLGYTASDSLVFSGALSPVIAEDVTNTLYGMAGRAGAGAGVSGLSGLGNIYNTVQNTKLQIGTLQTNLPHHGAASATTFLNLPMYPYIQFIQNVKMQGYDEGQYKLKVGHACDIWTTMTNMPENSLLQTTGMADMSSMAMELNEITELNNILQTGFYR